MAVNKFRNKYHEGTFANGEGPVLGQSIKIEAENKGLLPGTDGGMGRDLKVTSGKGELLAGTPADKNFDLHGKSYAGPQNWIPRSEGETHPFEINK